ncbi:Chitin synthase, class 3 [Irineochytrium annulatum]|nr:Chitin synthase, class 3 [Irineochytrium annulatum]
MSSRNVAGHVHRENEAGSSPQVEGAVEYRAAVIPIHVTTNAPTPNGGSPLPRIIQRPAFGSPFSRTQLPSPTATARSHTSRLVRPERQLRRSPSGRSLRTGPLLREDDEKVTPWRVFSWAVTCCALPWCLRKCGMRQLEVQQAWREKIALCLIAFFMCGLLGFLTYGFNTVVCKDDGASYYYKDVGKYTPATFPHRYIIHGNIYDLSTFIPWHNNLDGFVNHAYPTDQISAQTGLDISRFFPNIGPNCVSAISQIVTFECTSPNFTAIHHCHDYKTSYQALSSLWLGHVTYTWSDVEAVNSTLTVFKNRVIDLSQYLAANNSFFGTWADSVIQSHLRRDATHGFGIGGGLGRAVGECLSDLYTVGLIETTTIGCIATDIVLDLSLAVILTLVFVRFGLAIIFKWFISSELGKLAKAKESQAVPATIATIARQSPAPPLPTSSDSPQHDQQDTPQQPQRSVAHSATTPAFGLHDHQRGIVASATSPFPTFGRRSSKRNGIYIEKHTSTENSPVGTPAGEAGDVNKGGVDPHALTLQLANPSLHHQTPAAGSPSSFVSSVIEYFDSIYTVMLVTCYSESADDANLFVIGLKTTFDSLARTTFSEKHKLLFVIADGIITGSGNPKSTPDLILDMLELDTHWPRNPEPQSYLAIADGSKRHNKARVYVAWYNCDGHRVPTILVVKCGTADEQSNPKPGNRGKRDSQLILMNFFKRVMFDDQMCPLEFDLFRKTQFLMGVTPDFFEIVLMVDADTKVAPDSLSRMVAAMARDPLVMGLCGETRIANKSESWVSRIQVFEYYLSHHLNKAFESVFGGVTCLPGCFCMYRIKTPKMTPAGPRWVPILANPEIVSTYSENVVNTLHKKNLLLLGEDRFLTTLMLREFPRRKLIFVPSAFCKTVVPAEFKVLLSQRRRWINSTIHNLLELVLVRELCGIFCFSMQFVILIELIGTTVLPAAIMFTLLLIIMAIIGPVVPVIPLLLLAAILGLPAILVLLTTRRVVYIYWMMIYLMALPIWNFVLPVYAFWHFDDFSWGQTRVIEGEKKDDAHGGSDGKKIDAKAVPFRRWADWEVERRKAANATAERRKLKKKGHRLSDTASTHSLGPGVSASPSRDASALDLAEHMGRADVGGLTIEGGMLSIPKNTKSKSMTHVDIGVPAEESGRMFGDGLSQSGGRAGVPTVTASEADSSKQFDAASVESAVTANDPSSQLFLGLRTQTKS